MTVDIYKQKICNEIMQNIARNACCIENAPDIYQTAYMPLMEVYQEKKQGRL